MSKKSWVPILFVCLTIFLVVIIALAGTGAYLFHRHVEIATVSPESARAQFDEARKRFAGRDPLLSLEHDDVTVGKEGAAKLAEPATGSRSPLESLNVLTYDPQKDKIVKISIPFWLLRLRSGGGRLMLPDSSGLGSTVRLDANDLERFGPGLLLDQTRRGQRVLIWTQ